MCTELAKLMHRPSMSNVVEMLVIEKHAEYALCRAGCGQSRRSKPLSHENYQA
jgi:CDGSH-type Zn-finger protein